MVVAIIICTLLGLYVIGIFVYDAIKRKKGAPSIFVDVCESEGKGKRLLRQYRKMKGREGKKA